MFKIDINYNSLNNKQILLNDSLSKLNENINQLEPKINLVDENIYKIEFDFKKELKHNTKQFSLLWIVVSILIVVSCFSIYLHLYSK